VIKFAKAEYGPSALNELLEGQDRDILKVFEKRILVLSWYPYSAYIYLLKAIDLKWGNGDLIYCKRIGEHAATLDLKSFLRVYNARGGQKDLIKSSTMVWSSYYRNAGRMEAVSAEPENTVLRIMDFPEMDPAHCRLMEGWMSEAIKMIGTQLISGVTEVKCMSKGDPYHEFKCVWTPLIVR